MVCLRSGGVACADSGVPRKARRRRRTRSGTSRRRNAARDIDGKQDTENHFTDNPVVCLRGGGVACADSGVPRKARRRRRTRSGTSRRRNAARDIDGKQDTANHFTDRPVTHQPRGEISGTETNYTPDHSGGGPGLGRIRMRRGRGHHDRRPDPSNGGGHGKQRWRPRKQRWRPRKQPQQPQHRRPRR